MENDFQRGLHRGNAHELFGGASLPGHLAERQRSQKTWPPSHLTISWELRPSRTGMQGGHQLEHHSAGFGADLPGVGAAPQRLTV